MTYIANQYSDCCGCTEGIKLLFVILVVSNVVFLLYILYKNFKIKIEVR